MIEVYSMLIIYLIIQIDNSFINVDKKGVG